MIAIIHRFSTSVQRVLTRPRSLHETAANAAMNATTALNLVAAAALGGDRHYVATSSGDRECVLLCRGPAGHRRHIAASFSFILFCIRLCCFHRVGCSHRFLLAIQAATAGSSLATPWPRRCTGSTAPATFRHDMERWLRSSPCLRTTPAQS